MEDMAKILYGDVVAKTVHAEVQKGVALFQNLRKRTPHLVVVLSHASEASKIYVTRKASACREVGIRSTVIVRDCEKEEELIALINELNADTDIDGILLQAPLHPSMKMARVMDAIDPTKDVDGFSSENLGKLLQGQCDGMIPCTPKGIVRLLQFYDIPLAGQHVAILGRSAIVGKPLAMLLSSSLHNATVSLLHSWTKDPELITRLADIVIVAVGRPKILTDLMVREGVVVVDVGITRVQDAHGKHRIIGDIDDERLKHIASAFTPVPRGVGPMTVACLLENTLLAAERRI